MNIQKTLDSLQPYVIGIRYLEGTPLVDVIFKEGWTVPDDNQITKIKGDDGMNYYMIFSEVTGIGIDELLGYVEKTIKINLEREKKHELLKTKVNELKELFKKHTLTKLERLKFTFSEEDLVPTLNDFDIDIDDDTTTEITETPETVVNNVQVEEQLPVVKDTEGVDMSNLTEEEREILEEEARAEKNRKYLEAQKNKKSVSNISKKVELPPKRKIEMAISESFDDESDCECGPNEACAKCIDKKGF